MGQAYVWKVEGEGYWDKYGTWERWYECRVFTSKIKAMQYLAKLQAAFGSGKRLNYRYSVEYIRLVKWYGNK